VKDRVNEIKQDQDWKEKIAKEWNDAANEEEKDRKSKTSVFDYSKLLFKVFLTYIFINNRISGFITKLDIASFYAKQN